MSGPFLIKMENKPRVLIACNTLTAISGEIYPYHMKLFYNLGRRELNYDFMQLFAYRMSIDRFRTWAAETAMQHGCRYLVFIDDDMKLDPDAISKLLRGAEAGYDILAAFNYIRGYPFKIMSFKWDLSAKGRHLINLTQRDLDRFPEGGIIPCDAIGTAVCIIRTDTIRQVEKPYFLTGPHGTEDIYFCLKAQEQANAKIGMHTGVVTGHLLEPEVISHETKAALTAYYEMYMTPDEIARIKADNPEGLAMLPKVGNRKLSYEDLMKVIHDPLIQV